MALEDAPVSPESVFECDVDEDSWNTGSDLSEECGGGKVCFQFAAGKFMPGALKPPPVTLVGFYPETLIKHCGFISILLTVWKSVQPLWFLKNQIIDNIN